MYQQRAPGVRFEWLNPPAILAVGRTDVAGFVGIAARGPLHRAVKVESWTQFTSTFGAHIPQGYLAYAVEGFFARLTKRRLQRGVFHSLVSPQEAINLLNATES